MLDQPALLAHRGFLDSLAPDRRHAFLAAAIEQLPKTPKEQIVTLARSSANDKSYAEDVLTTNACGVFLGDTESHMGLFPEVSVSSIPGSIHHPTNSRTLLIAANQPCVQCQVRPNSPAHTDVRWLIKLSAFFRFSQRTLKMEVIAYRDIQRGEEISINCKPP